MDKNKLYRPINPAAIKVNNDGFKKWQEELKKIQCAAQKAIKQHQDNLNLKVASENFKKLTKKY